MAALDLCALVDVLPDAVIVVDTTGALRDANLTAEVRFGWPRDEWIGRSVFELIHPDDLEWAIASLTTVQDKEVGTPIELRVRSADEWRLVEVIGTAIEHEGDDFVVLCVRDLTERRLWEVAGDDLAMFRTILQNAAGLTFLTDETGRVLKVSAALIRLTGRGPDEAIGRDLGHLLVPSDRARLAQAIEGLIVADERQVNLEVVFAADGKAPVPCQLSIVNLLDDPTVRGLVVSAHDITELREARRELEHLAGHDALTGLPNRSRLIRVLAERLDPASPTAAEIVVAFLDLDRFKPVNDLYGHEIGDELLAAVAGRLRASVREAEVVARFGGDEFVVVTRRGAPHDAHRLGARLEATLSTPFRLSVGEIRLSASVGVAEAAPGDDLDTVIAEADSEMYEIKFSRRSATPHRGTVVARRRLAEEVRVALDAGDITAHYQPVVDLASGAIIGVEALARWEHPERGLLLPADFLDLIEAMGLGARLGEAVLRTAARDLDRLERATGATPGLAVNASVDEMTHPEYPARLGARLRHSGIAPERVTVEISERAMLERTSRTGIAVPTNLAALSDAGVHLAVDDFGTGYSSLTHLVSFPVDVIKIDRSFVAGVVGDAQRRSVIAALVGLAESTGMALVAEGIDQPAQVDVLQELGCPFGQGFHFAPPMPYEALALEMTYRNEPVTDAVESLV